MKGQVMKKLKLFFILTTIFCLLVSMIGCNKVETKQNDNEIITETIDTTATIYQIEYTENSNLFKITWYVSGKYETHYFDRVIEYDRYGDYSYKDGSPKSSTGEKDIVVCESYMPIKQYEKCKKIFNNKEEVKVTLVINYIYAKDGYYTEVSRKVIPDF